MKGTILIVALFIITLIEIVIAGFITYHRISIRHSKNYLDAYQALNLSYVGEELARTKILESFKKNDNMVHDKIPKTTFNKGYFTAEINDAQGNFNINNLSSTDFNFECFNNFMSNMTGSNGDNNAQSLIANIQKYTASYATGQAVPFRSTTELRPMPGMTKKFFLKLNQNITALPEPTSINVNSATAYSLLVLSPQMTMSAAEALIKIRDNQHGFKSVNQFMSLNPIFKKNGTQVPITTQSQYFIATIAVNYNNIDLILYSLFKVNKNNNGLSVSVIQRSFGML